MASIATDEPFTYKKPLELFEQNEIVKICAPMVRYSKLQFRQLVRKYGCDLAYTPMIMANSFTQSKKARDVEFTTNAFDRPLIVQFASSKLDEFATAAQLVQPFSDGVNLNCGCPQKWAAKEGVGAVMIKKPDLICEMIKEARRRLNHDPQFTVSAKIRIHEKVEDTIDVCRKLEAAGSSYITVHARTAQERHDPIHLDQLKIIKETIKQIPIVANGDLFTLDDCRRIKEETNINAFMCARGLLQNPAMFANYPTTPIECIRDWVKISLENGTNFIYFHSILMDMLEGVLNKSDRRFFNTLLTTGAVLEYLNENVFNK